MLTVIISENGASATQLESTLSSFTGLNQQVLLIAENLPANYAQALRSNFISARETSLSYCYRSAVERAMGESVLFVDARLCPTSEEVQSIIAAAMENTNSISYVTLSAGQETIELSEMSVEDLVTRTSQTTPWPVMCYSASKSFLRSEDSIDGKTGAEIGARMMIKAVCDNESMSSMSATISRSSEQYSELVGLCTLSSAERSRILSAVLDACNIEELYPRHPWSTHQEESAAACYHTLAATFIRLEDPQSASDCLTISDRLEDSPRSLALKGLLSLSRGETLGAVANMVASLQQYELRKESSSDHYVKFTPQNLEVINTKLKAGLEALNRRDNDTALKHFAEAVFNFDSFYQQCGIEGLPQ